MRHHTSLTIVALALAVLTGCAAAEEPLATETLAPPTAEGATTQPGSDPLPAGTDVLPTLLPMLGDNAGLVTAAVETEPGRISISTTIVDPRGADGSPEALRAISICEAARTMPGVTHVSVFEADATHFALFNHPSAPTECLEV